LLIEAANRVRRLRGLSTRDSLPFRIVIALAKADIWADLAAPELSSAFRVVAARPSVTVPRSDVLSSVHKASVLFLEELMPEVLATARALDPRFRVVPFSGLGKAPSWDLAGTGLRIRPQDVRPIWPAAPLVVALSEAEPAMFAEYASS
jgi:hypothetical protein